MAKRIKLVALVQMPPPIHGVSRANQILFDDPQIAETFDVHLINLSAGGQRAGRGNASASKILRGVGVAAQLIAALPGKDLVYITPSLQGAALWRDIALTRICRWFKVPYVLHPHSGGIGTNDRGERFSKRLQKGVESLFSGAAKVLLLSESLRAGYADVLPSTMPTAVVGNGVLETAAPKPKPAAPLRLGFMGNLINYKGFHHALDVLAQLPDATLDVVGDFVSKDYRAQIRSQIDELDLQTRVRFHGAQPPEDAWRYLEDCHVFLFTSDWREGLPLVWLEAMMRGLPVASFRIGAWDLLEAVDARLLAEIGDSKALASQIREVTQDTHELGALCERVRSYALQELTASAWVGRIHKALEL